jgi:hypothetical protein
MSNSPLLKSLSNKSILSDNSNNSNANNIDGDALVNNDSFENAVEMFDKASELANSGDLDASIPLYQYVRNIYIYVIIIILKFIIFKFIIFKLIY